MLSRLSKLSSNQYFAASPWPRLALFALFALVSTGLAIFHAPGLSQTVSAQSQRPPLPTPAYFPIVVDSTGDGDNTGTGGVCDDGTGHCTLRAAIEVANEGGNHIIEFSIPSSDPNCDASTGQ